MRVLMLGTHRGSPDGVTVNTYQEGECYEVSERLGTVFVTEGWAEIAKEPEAETEAEDAPDADDTSEEEATDSEAEAPDPGDAEEQPDKPTRKGRRRR